MRSPRWSRPSEPHPPAASRTERRRILVVDDDRDIQDLLTRYLELEDYEVEVAPDGRDAIAILETRAPDLMLLDLSLPFVDGLEVLAQTRRKSDVPIILLTGRGDEGDRVLGLKMGADDYVVKPFSPTELTARISSVFRRAGSAATASLRFDGLSIDTTTKQVRVRDEVVALTAKQFQLLVHLASSPRQVFSREELLERVWQSSSAWQSADTVTEHVRRLRRQIEEDPAHPRWITTVWGVGYRFEP